MHCMIVLLLLTVSLHSMHIILNWIPFYGGAKNIFFQRCWSFSGLMFYEIFDDDIFLLECFLFNNIQCLSPRITQSQVMPIVIKKKKCLFAQEGLVGERSEFASKIVAFSEDEFNQLERLLTRTCPASKIVQHLRVTVSRAPIAPGSICIN